MRYGDKGDQVRALQQRLVELGYDIGHWGADGALGDDTWEALRQLARDRKLPWKVEVPTDVVAAADATAPGPEPWIIPDDYLTDVTVLDVRQYLEEPQHKAKTRDGRTVMRPPASVTGITLHQTACEFHIGQAMLRRADGDYDLAHALRVQQTACHLMALQEGFVVWTRPLRSYVYHGNGLNGFTIGIEIEGHYAGLKGNPGTVWSGSPYSGPVSDATIRAARKALLVAVTEGRRQGMPIQHLYAHRQASGTRRSDPGQELWQAVALDYGVAELGLTVHPEATFESQSSGRGRPIPTEWDPEHGIGQY